MITRWNGLPREVVAWLFMEVFKERLDMPLCHGLVDQCGVWWQVGLNDLRGLFQPVILWLYSFPSCLMCRSGFNRVTEHLRDGSTKLPAKGNSPQQHCWSPGYNSGVWHGSMSNGNGHRQQQPNDVPTPGTQYQWSFSLKSPPVQQKTSVAVLSF